MPKIPIVHHFIDDDCERGLNDDDSIISEENHSAAMSKMVSFVPFLFVILAMVIIPVIILYTPGSVGGGDNNTVKNVTYGNNIFESFSMIKTLKDNAQQTDDFAATRRNAFAPGDNDTATNSTSPEVNQPIPDCGEWEAVVDGKCVHYLDFAPGTRYKWQVYRILFPTLFYIMALVFLHDLFRKWYVWRSAVEEYAMKRLNDNKRINGNDGIDIETKKKSSNKSKMKHPASDAIVYAYACCFISCILMGTACIDGWGFFGTYSAATYLGIYAIPYGMIIPSSIGLTSIHLFDIFIIGAKQDAMKANRGYAFVSIIFMAVVVLYGSVGFSIFGFVLASKITDNPGTKLGVIGNRLQYTSLSLALIILFFFIGPVIIIFYRYTRKITDDSDNSLKRSSKRIQSWATRQFFSCAFLLIFMVCNDYLNTNGGLLTTLDMLYWNRIIELYLLMNTHELRVGKDFKVIDITPFFYFFVVFGFFKDYIKFQSSSGTTATSPTSLELRTITHDNNNNNNSSRKSKNSKSSGPKPPNNSFITSTDDEMVVADEKRNSSYGKSSSPLSSSFKKKGLIVEVVNENGKSFCENDEDDDQTSTNDSDETTTTTEDDGMPISIVENNVPSSPKNKRSPSNKFAVRSSKRKALLKGASSNHSSTPSISHTDQ